MKTLNAPRPDPSPLPQDLSDRKVKARGWFEALRDDI